MIKIKELPVFKLTKVVYNDWLPTVGLQGYTIHRSKWSINGNNHE